MLIIKPSYGLPRIIIALLTTAVLAVATSPELEAYERATNQSLLWGPYRPNLYFGVRPRIPDGLLMGLMWAKVEDYQSIQNSTCTIDRDSDIS
jgi:mannosyl-oligosaccharide glucosidase